LRRHNPHAEHYAEWIKNCPDDLWGQTGAAHRNNPGDDSAETLIETLVGQLQLQPSDVLLDLGCGNGALTNLIFDHCSGGVGIDYTEALIETAKVRFETPSRLYFNRDMLSGVSELLDPGCFTKAMSYGAFQYLWPEDATKVLAQLHDRFPNISRIVLGGLPDRAELPNLPKYVIPELFPNGIPDDFASDAHSLFGVWRTKDDVMRLGAESGWQVEIAPLRGIQGKYRFNAILTRR
jgi:cyclopropane fatty-acyl-phospholipid synthase-like methyltransferase